MIKTIALHEFLFTIKRKAYYLVTLGMPLIVIGYLGLISLIILVSVPSEIAEVSKPIGLIDESGLLSGPDGIFENVEFGETVVIAGTELEDEDLEEMTESFKDLDLASFDIRPERKLIRVKDLDAAKELLAGETIRNVTVVPEDYLSGGKFQVYVKTSKLIGVPDSGWLSSTIADEILKTTDLTDDEIARIQGTSGAKEFEIVVDKGQPIETGEFAEVNKLAKGLSLGIPIAVAVLLVVALMMNASLLLASIAEEKENKVMEVIVSSVSADQLLFGKVIGIVMAGMLQILIWMLMVSVIPILLMFALKEFVDYDVNINQLLIGGLFMVMGFFFYGALLAGMGSLGSTYKDVQQLSAVVILCACVPMMAPTVFISAPNGMVARIMSMIPFFSPVAMMFRLGSGEIPIWEVALSLVILLVATYIAIKLGAKLFRAGTLMNGKRPSVRDIWKVLIEPA